MGTLYLVRHGQASFGAANYDCLSALGARQCERLGAWFRARGVRFDAVIRGSLDRHAQSLDAIVRGYGDGLPDPVVRPGLNEYDSAAVVRAVHPEPLPPATTPEAYRHHFRILRDGLAAWIEGRCTPEGMPCHADFCSGITAVLDEVRSGHGGDVLLVSSGGPIATAVAHVLGAPPLAAIELNLRIRNSALTEFAVNPKRHALLSFNHLPHLEALPAAEWVTYT